MLISIRYRAVIRKNLNHSSQLARHQNCMLPRQSIGIAIDSVEKTDAQDFANLMPRPGWQSGLGSYGSDHL